MKADITNNGSKTTLATSPQKWETKKSPLANKSDPKTTANQTSPDYKLDLSTAAKVPAPSVTQPVPSAPSVPDAPKVDKPDTPEIPKEAKELKDVPKLKEIYKDTKVAKEKKPLIVFIKGLGLLSSPSKSEGSYAGVGRMAESIEGARVYGWDQHDEIIKEVNKTHKDYPVILVGHSLGGDTAMEVAEELDSLEHGFRKVDLLVTIDSVGFNNDVVPQNVKKHLNIFGEDNFVLNDGPHVARKHDRTDVKNILTTIDHTEMDDHKEIQFEIVSMIQEALSKKA